VFASAADAGAGKEGAVLAHGIGAVFESVADGDGFLGEVLHHAEADGVGEFVHAVGVFGGCVGGAAF
jgi:hypothetical protein